MVIRSERWKTMIVFYKALKHYSDEEILFLIFYNITSDKSSSFFLLPLYLSYIWAQVNKENKCVYITQLNLIKYYSNNVISGKVSVIL